MSYVSVDTTCADMELDRLQRGFTTEDHFNFASVLFTNYVQTQEDAHVITGSLRGSGIAEVDVARDSRWEGNISYGGASYGPRNPVKYAVYEIFKQRDLQYDHYLFRRTDHIDDEYVGPLTTFLARGRKLPHPEGERL